MKVLHVSYSDLNGGAARAVYRLHSGLIGAGVDSKILVVDKRSLDSNVLAPNSIIKKIMGVIRRYLDRAILYFYPSARSVPFSTSLVPFSKLVKKINAQNADVVHLHWMASGMLTFNQLKKINKPIVWTLHDMWVFTGGCHYTSSCSNYISGCGQCPLLDSTKKSDLTSFINKNRKNGIELIDNITFIAVSDWLNDTAQKSTILKKQKVITLPNPIDTFKFSPINKDNAKEILGINKNKKVILFGAISATKDPRKGYDKLIEALEKMSPDKYELVVFGGAKNKAITNMGFKSHFFEFLHDDLSLKVLYNAADVTVVPSIQEAFGQTATESMACGTPVVAFDETGVSDIIDHKENGYLASDFSAVELSKGISWVLENEAYNAMCERAVKKVTLEFSMPAVTKRYKNLYSSIIESSNVS